MNLYITHYRRLLSRYNTYDLDSAIVHSMESDGFTTCGKKVALLS